jgi:hypothetical protein
MLPKKRLIGLLGMLLLSGCVSHHKRVVVVHEPVATVPSGDVIVTTEPPAPRREVIGVAPSAQHVWVKGYWVYQNRHWVWVPGHWEVRPRAAAVWVEGHWSRTSGGWRWTPGHWD